MSSNPAHRLAIVLALCLSIAACAGAGAATPSPSPAGATQDGDTVRIAAVGDMVCSTEANAEADPHSTDRRYKRGFCQYKKVSNLLTSGDYDRFLPLGDLQYYFGHLDDYERFYEPTFGRVMDITEPVAGNHDSYTLDAAGNPYAGYRDYFGNRAHWNKKGGAYSYDLGSWHIIGLNSQWCHDFTWAAPAGKWEHVPNWSRGSPWGCHAGDPQREWLVRDLEAHADAGCTLAYFHHPAYFWVGYAGGPETLTHEGYTMSRPLYRVLYRHGADVVLTGHEHLYQRFQPMNPKAEIDQQYGFTEFIVGTGGDTLQPMPPDSARIPQVAAASNTAFGILQMDLKPGAFDWEFVPAAGSPGTWRYSEKDGYKIFENGDGTGEVDSGSANCHGAPPTT